ncbi:hypothetical protein [Alicyclobacillus acidiphilus]|jgi:hypothetical protein|uniref:hypothetical protein n=1 Tax=Alicyclobacillus acidiphilus TaxID=182455 RepID=UPI00083241F1|nr:hypothetical protein [Alicyclobacillus acidiphilus]
MTDQPEFQGKSVAERTMEAVHWMEQRIRANAKGLDRIIVSQAIPMIHPRLEGRIRGVTEDELRAELKYVLQLIQGVLGDDSEKSSTKLPPRKRKSPRRQSRKGSSSR